ncbi:hypothetical protein N7466_003844 [Penicillium verhagenii]|uniref:uncharacterized protein n=1 Tax=Penicillium verhagenii TaxID=1562060 RepID=UPI002545522D|nr:uncharacterized protein N7466_003844 [Penicillium verhagenii]KAJ5934297.1 hypothetical protein N7466_003844 [Penicillium verhagenii]
MTSPGVTLPSSLEIGGSLDLVVNGIFSPLGMGAGPPPGVWFPGLSWAFFPSVNSGSKVTFREFLTMRIIRPRLEDLGKFPHEETSEAVANDIIQADATFMAWLSEVGNKNRPDKGLLGIFALVKQGMLMVTARDSVEPPFESARLRPRSSAPVEQPHLPAEGSSMDVERATSTSENVVTRVTPAEENLWAPFPKTAAEEEINYFLLNLLNAYTLSLNAGVRCEWIAHQNPFLTVSFGQVELTAYVDGYLRHIGGHECRTSFRSMVFRSKLGNTSQLVVLGGHLLV